MTPELGPGDIWILVNIKRWCILPFRVSCELHGVLQVDVPWAESNSRFTLLFEAYAIDWLQEANINVVVWRLKRSWNAIDGIMSKEACAPAHMSAQNILL